ncbi:WxcM-like domain-containing protein [uncultured Planktosalinus sp.]|uniref:WxcM-like domain-containing protein n=1 Tax=uncultured Planktosalinus sp. TaxID=1810935 RepID=UPI0030DDDE17
MIINGNKFVDHRGELHSFNEFDLSEIKRMYTVFHPDTNTIRAWQGHKIERRWFYCVKGSFEVRTIELDCMENPSIDLDVKKTILEEKTPMILKIQPGFVNGFRALEKNSTLISFSDYKFGENHDDEIRFDVDKWIRWH